MGRVQRFHFLLQNFQAAQFIGRPQSLADGWVDIRNVVEPLQNCLYVETGASTKDYITVPFEQVMNAHQRIGTIGRSIIRLCNRMRIDEMMRCRLKFVGSWLGCSDRHFPKELSCIGRYDMTVQLPGEHNCHARFSHCGGASNHDQFLPILHREPNLTGLLLLGRFSLSFALENHTIDD